MTPPPHTHAPPPHTTQSANQPANQITHHPVTPVRITAPPMRVPAEHVQTLRVHLTATGQILGLGDRKRIRIGFTVGTCVDGPSILLNTQPKSRGTTDKWRQMFRVSQTERANAMVPDALLDRFGWVR